jgi:predicted transcriptional regulator
MGGDTAIWFRDEDPECGMVAHEAFHAVEGMLRYLDTPHDTEYTSEIYAYTLGYIVDRIHSKIVEHDKKKKAQKSRATESK